MAINDPLLLLSLDITPKFSQLSLMTVIKSESLKYIDGGLTFPE